MIPVHIIGFIYAIFYLKEPKDNEHKEEHAYDNQALSSESSINGTNNIPIINEEPLNSKIQHGNAFLEFFDPQHAIYCVRSFIKRRDFGLRKIIILFMLMHFLMNGITQGESQNLLLYGRVKLNWDVRYYVYHNVFTISMGLIGTSLALVFSKMLQIADIILIILSTLLSIVCRGVYIFAKSIEMFFIGTGVDFMYSVKFLGARSIISKIVPAEDLSTMFAIMGLFEALAGFVFPYVYPTFYLFLLKNPDHDVSEMFALSGIIFIAALMIYV